MCGRFSNQAKPQQITREFNARSGNNPGHFEAKYNIAPSQMIDVVFEPEGNRVITQLKWGLIPSWSKDAGIGNSIINARAETINEKPSFREAFKKRRCIIPATGFYEWKKASSGSAKQPYYFYLTEKNVFGFAGLWEEWVDKKTGELLETFAIITTTANDVLKPVHDRMPVILHSENYDQWLDKEVKEPDILQSLLKPYPPVEMASHPVSKAVNIPATSSPELIVPINSL